MVWFAGSFVVEASFPIVRWNWYTKQNKPRKEGQGIMRKQIWMTASAMLTGALWATGASAVSLPVANLTPGPSPAQNHTGTVVNLNLGSLPASDASLALWPDSMNVAQGVQFGLTRAANWDSFGELFSVTAQNSAYLSGTNMRAGASFALGRDLGLNVGHVALGLGPLSDAQPSTFSRDFAERLGVNLLSSGTSSASLNWNFTDWASVAVTATQSTGNALLLANGDSFAGGRASESSALGISARADVAEGWVTTLAYSQGVTQLGLNRNAIVASPDTVRSDAYGIGLAKNGLFGNDALGIALSRPLQIYPANNGFGLVNANSVLAGTQARESDVQLGYVTTFLDGTLALQANAAYQLNAAGARGENALVGVARAKLNF